MKEHINNLNEILNLDDIGSVLDCGSGKTSLTFLTNKYPNAKVDAVVYPGDMRKINSIKENVKGNYNLIEIDICKRKITKKYDLVLAHLLIGEATTFGNSSESLIDRLLKIDSNYFLIYDYLEDVTINYDYLYRRIKENFKILDQKDFLKHEPQQFAKFLGKTYRAILIERK